MLRCLAGFVKAGAIDPYVFAAAVGSHGLYRLVWPRATRSSALIPGWLTLAAFTGLAGPHEMPVAGLVRQSTEIHRRTECS